MLQYRLDLIHQRSSDFFFFLALFLFGNLLSDGEIMCMGGGLGKPMFQFSVVTRSANLEYPPPAWRLNDRQV